MFYPKDVPHTSVVDGSQLWGQYCDLKPVSNDF